MEALKKVNKKAAFTVLGFKITTFFAVLFFLILMVAVLAFTYNIVVKPYLSTYYVVKPHVLAEKAINCLSFKDDNGITSFGLLDYSTFTNDVIRDCFQNNPSTVEVWLHFIDQTTGKQVLKVISTDYVQPVGKKPVVYPVSVITGKGVVNGYVEVFSSE